MASNAAPASPSTERSPLLAEPSRPTPPRHQRTVTFNPHTTISHPENAAQTSALLRPASASPPANPNPLHSTAAAQPKISALNSKLRRRNSHGSPLGPQAPLNPASKIGPQRTTKNAQKLKLLPNPDPSEVGEDEESGRDVYSQFTRIKDPTARRDAARLGKADREKLPRVTAYCTADGYKIEAMMKWLKSKKAKSKGSNPKIFDECIYTPYNYGQLRDGTIPEPNDTLNGPSRPQRERRFSDSALEIEGNTSQRREDLIDITTSAGDTSLEDGSPLLSNNATEELLEHHDTSALSTQEDFDTTVDVPEVFLFAYGTVVIWGMTLSQETQFLREIARFEQDSLLPADIQTENFNFYYTREYQARIYNDFISLREKRNYMTKLAISHALAQSVKTSLFEDSLATNIASTQSLPEQIALTGSIALSRREIHQQIGQLFVLRINIHLQGSVLDSPELMWAEPSLEPIYTAVRSYLEMDQRVTLLTERLSVIGDLLAVLKDQVGTKHGEYLEWIVIILIAAEILVAAINIVVDLYAGVD